MVLYLLTLSSLKQAKNRQIERVIEMINNNELFKTYIQNTVKMINRNLLIPSEALNLVKGYYKALNDMNATNPLIDLYYKEFNNLILGDNNHLKEISRSILEV